MLSSSKLGGIYIPPCNDSDTLYPSDQPPSSWKSCNDAYEYTWTHDPDMLLGSLSDMQRMKLARSSGFCPQYRCQLDRLGNGDSEGHCPAGLCYTKVEYGGASFGACCFINGTFLAGRLIGYYDKLQVSAKPIYNKYRVILSGQDHEDSYARFVNAHWLRPGLIATQCPMHNTLPDLLRMILQQRIHSWLHIYTPKTDCLLLSEAFQDYASVRIERPEGQAILQPHILSICHSLPSLQPMPWIHDHCTGRVHTMRYIVYSRWEDFMVPPAEDQQALDNLASSFASLISYQHTVAVNCLSGRGRTGSFSALLLGHLLQLSSHEQLIDTIVSLRERRDGLVETPRQYLFVAQQLNMSSLVSIAPAASVMLLGAGAGAREQDSQMFNYQSMQVILLMLLCAMCCVYLPLWYLASKRHSI